jgi:hypothetical protein
MVKANSCYCLGNGGTVNVLPMPQGFENSPIGSGNTNWSFGQIGFTPLNQPTEFFIYGGAITGWVEFATSGGDVTSITATSPLTANGVSGSAQGGAVTLAIPNPLPVANGGTGDSSFIAYTLLAAGTTTTGALQNLASVGTTGQYLTSNGPGELPTFQTATPQLTVTPVAGASQAMTSNHMYIANDSAQTTFTLPAASSVGDIIQILGSALNTGGWIVSAVSPGKVIWGPAGSSSATGATSASAAAQAMNIVCVVANTTWVIVNNSGTITLS